jgi:hypothetical protein
LNAYYLWTACVAMLGVFLGHRLGLWWARKSLDRIINDRLKGAGLQVSDEMAMLLRRPTVDGVARKMIRKMGLCAYSDIRLEGTTITLVCHDKKLLQRACDGIVATKPAIEEHMQGAMDSAAAEKAMAAIAKQHAPDGPVPAFKAPPLPTPPPPMPPGLRIIDGGKQ